MSPDANRLDLGGGEAELHPKDYIVCEGCVSALDGVDIEISKNMVNLIPFVMGCSTRWNRAS
jgi:hypothetical protein